MRVVSASQDSVECDRNGTRRGVGVVVPSRCAGTAMERTPTAPLAGVRDRLEDYARGFRPRFQRIDQSLHAREYLHGLLLDGERKSVEP